MPSVDTVKRLSLRARIMVVLVGLVTVTIAVVVFVQDTRQGRMLMQLEQKRGMAIARSLAAATATPLLTYNYVSLQQLAERAVKEEGVEYVIVLDKEGAVAGFSGQPQRQGERMEDSISRTAFASRDVLIQEVPVLLRSRSPGLDIAVPVYVDGSPEKWGMVRVGLSLAPVLAEVNRTRTWVLGLGFIVLALAIVAAQLLTRRITGPLNRLVEATGELAKGNFDYRLGLRTGDEIEGLSQKFDDMCTIIRQKQDEVAASNQELAALNASLEEKVRERTQEVAEAEEKYRLLVEQSPNAICIIQKGVLRFFNQAFCTTFGYTRKELDSREWPFIEFMDESQRDIIRTALESPLPSGQTATATREIVGRHRDASLVHLDMRSIWVSYAGVPALEAILVDVTEQRKIQEGIVSYERLRALGEMASGVAHDFNNVLGAILGRAQLLQRRVDNEDVLRGLRIIEKAAQDGSVTVKRIQEFSRVRTDREFAAVDLNAVLEDVIEMTRSRWEDEAYKAGKKVEIQREFQEIPRIEGNIFELRELFMNFILNAVDAIDRSGTITVSTAQEGARVVAGIADTGKGMSEDVQRKLFDPFFSTKGPQGTGLGMSIAYGTIRRHGADIKLQSEEGEGTSFRIRFPVLMEAGGEEPGVDAAQPTPASGLVLVVDDEEAVRSLVADILTEGGYRVETAEGGGEAVHKLEKGGFDLVITDLGMPGVSGWDVAKFCRRTHPATAIILLTGWGATLDAEAAGSSGVDKILKKPFEMEEILRAAHEVLGGQGLARSA